MKWIKEQIRDMGLVSFIFMVLVMVPLIIVTSPFILLEFLNEWSMTWFEEPEEEL